MTNKRIFTFSLLLSVLMFTSCAQSFNCDFRGDSKVLSSSVDVSVSILKSNYVRSDDYTYSSFIDAVTKAICDWDNENNNVLSKLNFENFQVEESKLFDDSCKTGITMYIVDRLFGNHRDNWNESKGPQILYIGGYLSHKKMTTDCYDPGFP